jgi:2-aminobenzoate-CoA ligase
VSNLPPRELWPELVYRLPELQYADTLNVADQLLTPQLARGEGGHAAILYRHETISYAALARRALSLAAELARRGIRPGDRIALRVPNRPDFVIAWLAAQWLGAIVVSIPPLYRRREIAHIVNHSGTTAIICADDLIDDIVTAKSDFSRDVLVLVSPVRCPAADDGPFPAAHATGRDEPALITYITSADGPPKGVVQSRAEILAAADTYARDVLRLTSRDVCIGHPALAWAFGLGALLVFPLRVGATTVLVDGLSPTLLEAAVASRATVLFCVPTMYRLLLRQPDLSSFDLSALRCCVSSAEPLPAAVLEEWRARTGLEILDGLGTTELGHIFISSRPGMVRAGRIGMPVAGYEARIVDAELGTVPDGTPGLLAIRGPTGCRYWRDPDAQRQAVRRGWTLTGDICVRHEDGMFEHRGRADNLIVSGGYKISPLEVTRVLLDHPAVSRASVLMSPDPVRGAVPKAVIVPAPGAERSGLVETLQQYLKRELAPYKCPREIRLA